MKNKSYQVKLKIDIPGYRNKFFEGIALAESPQKAKDLAIDYTLECVLKGNEPLKGVLTRDHIKATKCDKIKDDFIVNQSTYKSNGSNNQPSGSSANN